MLQVVTGTYAYVLCFHKTMSREQFFVKNQSQALSLHESPYVRNFTHRGSSR